MNNGFGQLKTQLPCPIKVSNWGWWQINFNYRKVFIVIYLGFCKIMIKLIVGKCKEENVIFSPDPNL